MNAAENPDKATEPSCDGQTGADTPLGTSPGKVERIWRNEAGQLIVHLAGRQDPVVNVKIARCFPWSMPQTYISIRNKDGKEVVLLETLDHLDAASRQVVLQELHDRVFSPRILRIVEHKSEFGITSVKAETDRGQVTFQIRSRDDIRVLSATRLLFRDADGNTYEVADAATLDPTSRKFLETYF